MGRRRRSFSTKSLIGLLISAVTVLVWQLFPLDYDHARVAKVFDGDTFQLVNGEKVRLIGIDCPETHENRKLFSDAKRTGRDIETIKRMGRRSYAVTQELALGKPVRLEFDVERKDKYGRLLAYVYLPKEDARLKDIGAEDLVTVTKKNDEGQDEPYIFLNATLVKSGYASPMTISPNVRHAVLFNRLSAEARGKKRGLWKNS